MFSERAHKSKTKEDIWPMCIIMASDSFSVCLCPSLYFSSIAFYIILKTEVYTILIFS